MRFLLGTLVLFLFISCECKEQFICRDMAALEGSEELLDKIWIQVPNVIVDELENHIIVYTYPVDSIDVPLIVNYRYEISIEDQFSYSTTNLSYISDNGRSIVIPQVDMYQSGNYSEGRASYSLRLFFNDKEGFIDLVNGELLLVSCETLQSGVVVDKDCRYGFQILPPSGFSDGPDSQLLCI